MEQVLPTDRRPVPYKTRIEKSGKYTPKYPIRPSKITVGDVTKCKRAQNPRTFKKGRVRVYGSKEDVFRGRAMVTRGGLRQKDLKSRRIKGRRMVVKRWWYNQTPAQRRQDKLDTPLA